MPREGEPESRIELTDRLRREGREEAAATFRREVIDELREVGVSTAERRRIAWAEMAKRFPPLEPEKKPEEEVEPEDEEGPEDGAPTSDASFGLLPADWPPLPDSAPWREELEWAYQNGFFVIVEKRGGVVSYRWAALLMKLLAESRKNFMDLLGKAKAGSGEEETEGVKREKYRAEQIEEMLLKLREKKDEVPAEE